MQTIQLKYNRKNTLQCKGNKQKIRAVSLVGPESIWPTCLMAQATSPWLLLFNSCRSLHLWPWPKITPAITKSKQKSQMFQLAAISLPVYPPCLQSILPCSNFLPGELSFLFRIPGIWGYYPSLTIPSSLILAGCHLPDRHCPKVLGVAKYLEQAL